MTFFAQQISAILGIALLVLGLGVAWLARDALKRVGGVAVAGFAAFAAAAALGAPQALLVGGVAVALAQIATGVAIVVRLREAYGTTEIADIDVNDRASEPPGPAA